MTNPKVYLIDGSAYIFRAYYAVAALSTKDGFPTNALFGFTRMLTKLLREADSDRLVMVFDAGAKTFRNEIFPAYKANRSECPPDLKEQMPFFRDISRALGLPPVELLGFEADDVIGTLAEKLGAAGYEVIIVSGDKDLLQLVGGGISVWDPMKDQHFDVAQVKKKMGVPPEQVVELLALTGDSSDNIPGLPGVGPKTALQLLEKYGSVTALLAAAAEVGQDPSLRNRKRIAAELEQSADLLRLSRRLVEIDRAAPVLLEGPAGIRPLAELPVAELLDSLIRQPPDRSRLRSLADKFEFHSMLAEFTEGATAVGDLSSGQADNYITIFREDFAAWLVELRQQPAFAFDLETTSLNLPEAQVVGVSFCWDNERAYYLPLGHSEGAGVERQLRWSEFSAACSEIMATAAVQKYGQNLKYDLGVLKNCGLTVAGVAFDTMVAAYLLNPDGRRFKLSVLARDYLGRESLEFSEVAGPSADFAKVSIAEAACYAGQDALLVWLLQAKLRPLLEQEKLWSIFQDLEMPLVPVLTAMELAGVAIDRDVLAALSQEFGLAMAELEGQIYQAAGCEFNLNSPKQLAEVLFEKLGISTQGLKKTKTGISTDQGVLEKISRRHQVPALILEYRRLSKLKNTYVDALPEQISPVSGRVHSRFNQTVTGTGRLSSSDPNLQNVPIQSAAGRRIREAFVPTTGRLLLSADYSQIELRVLAHMSEDPGLMAAFREGVDIHSKTARELLGRASGAELSAEERRLGKTINFGIVYGMGPYRLAQDLGIPVGVASGYITAYFNRYRGVKEYFEQVKALAEKQGFVSTLLGRRRLIDTVDAGGRDKGFLERVAINAPIQGTAADIIKLAMIKIQQRIERESLPLLLILQVHDELVLECDQSWVAAGAELVRREMEGAINLLVPLQVAVGWGQNWAEAH